MRVNRTASAALPKSSFSRHRVEVTTRDGVGLAVCDTGPRSAACTVVLLHGMCLNQMSWARHVADLRKRYGNAVRIISFDHRGHGASGSAPMGTYGVDQLGADLADVLTARGVAGRVILAGHSMGAMAVLAYLSRPVADRPVEPEGLVLAATAAGGLVERGLGRLLATPGLDMLCAVVDHTPEQVLGAVAGPLATVLRQYCSHVNPCRATAGSLVASAVATTPLRTAMGFLRSLKVYDQLSGLGAIRARTVIIVSGGADPLTPVAHARELVAGIPGAMHRHVPTAGHMLLQEAPDAVQLALCEAIGEVMQRQRPVGGRTQWTAAANRAVGAEWAALEGTGR
jgi:pimeloyl-ACP methyl ester carboxylesterase